MKRSRNFPGRRLICVDTAQPNGLGRIIPHDQITNHGRALAMLASKLAHGCHRRRHMTYMGKPYYPLWLDDLADDVRLEAAAMVDGAARGADDVRTIMGRCPAKNMSTRSSPTPAPGARTVSSRTIPARYAACLPTFVVLVAVNAVGQTQHVLGPTTGHVARCCSFPA